MRRQRLAAHPGQGRRRRPDARRAARGHGPRRDPGRRDGDGDDARRLPGAQGRARRRRPRRRPADRGRLLMADEVRIGMLGSGLHRGPLRCPACGTCRAPGSWPTPATGGARGAAVRDRHGIARTYDSMDGLCADPEVDLVVVALPNHLHLEAVRAAAAARQGRRCARSRSAGTPRRPPRCSASSRTPACSTATSRTRSSARRSCKIARDGRVGRARTGAHDPRARGPLRSARGALLGRRDRRRRRVPRHGLPLHRGRPLHLRQGRAGSRRVRLGRDARPRRQDDRRGQRRSRSSASRTAGRRRSRRRGRPRAASRSATRSTASAAGSSTTSARRRSGRSSSEPAGYLGREDRRRHRLGLSRSPTSRASTATTR